MKKKIIALICSVIMLCSTAAIFTACDGCGGGIKWDANVLVVSAASTKQYDKSNWGKDQVSKHITNDLFKGKLTGVEGKDTVAFDISYSTAGWTDTLNNYLLSDSLPEVILDCDNSTLEKLIDKDKVLVLNEYLEQEGKYENIKKYFTQDRLNAIGIKDEEGNNNIYGFNAGINEQPSAGDWYVQVQYRLLEYFDYPDDIFTLDRLLYYVEEYMKAHPGENNEGIMIPLAGTAMGQNVGNTSLRLAGQQDDGWFYIDPVSLQAKYTLATDYAKEFVGWLNEAYNTTVSGKKVLSETCFSSLYPDIRSEAAKGNVLVCIEPDWQLAEAEMALYEAGKTDCRYAKLPIYFDGVDADTSKVCNYDSKTGTWRAVLTTNCKNPEAVLQFFDYMWSEEGQIAAQWGVEGKTYTVENGVRVMEEKYVEDYYVNSEFSQDTGIGLYGYWSQGGGALCEDGQQVCPFSAPEMIQRGYKDIDKEVIAIYAEKMGKTNVTTWKDLWAEGTQSPYGMAYKITITNKGATQEETDLKKASKKAYEELDTNLASTKLGAMIAGSTANFETAWNAWIDLVYSDQIVSGAPAAGIGYREYQYEMAIRERLASWYPTSYAEWLNDDNQTVDVPSAAQKRTDTPAGDFNWFERDLTNG